MQRIVKVKKHTISLLSHSFSAASVDKIIECVILAVLRYFSQSNSVLIVLHVGMSAAEEFLVVKSNHIRPTVLCSI